MTQARERAHLAKTMKLIKPVGNGLAIPAHRQLKRIIDLLFIIIAFSISLYLFLLEKEKGGK